MSFRGDATLCRVQQSYLLYEPLLKAGYRLLRECSSPLLYCCFIDIVHRLQTTSGSSMQTVPGRVYFPSYVHIISHLFTPLTFPSCAAQLKLIRSQYQTAFINAPDAHWKGENASVRVIGEGAGNFTYVLMSGAGHMVRSRPLIISRIRLTMWM